MSEIKTYKYHFQGIATLKSEKYAIFAAQAYRKTVEKSKGTAKVWEEKYDATYLITPDGEKMILDVWGNNKKDIDPGKINFEDTVARILQKIPGSRIGGIVFSRMKLDRVKAFLKENKLTESTFEELH